VIREPRRVLDVRALGETREVLACQDGGLFPVLGCAGGAIVAAVRGGAGHVGVAGRVEVIRSLDAGATWSPPAVVADSDRDDRNPALGRSADGTLVLAYQRMGCYDEDGVYRPDLRAADGSRPVEVMVTRSGDAGLSWEAPAPLGAAGVADGSPYGKIACLDDGALLLAIYARAGGDRDGATASYAVRSTDGGRTWGAPALIAEDMNETALCPLAGGGVLAVMRDAGPSQALHGARSDDGGRSWSRPEPVTGADRHPADLIELAGGDVLLTYGNRTPPYRIEGLLSGDGGASWRDCLLLFSGALHGYGGQPARHTDLGYPSSAVHRGDGRGEGGRGVTMYYLHPAGSRGGAGPAHLRPPYLAAGYRAVAITWCEDELVEAARRLI
jgi:hypothetical protein